MTIGTITVVNKYKPLVTPENTKVVYIGRPSILGNPYEIKQGQGRDKVCDMYVKHMMDSYKENSRYRNELRRLAQLIKDGKNLYLQCYCAPSRCHGDSLKVMIETLVLDKEADQSWLK